MINNFRLLKENLDEFLLESFDDEINKLKQHGYELIDVKDIENYKIFLVYLPDANFYEIGLTSNDSDFTTTDSQLTKKTDTTITIF